MSTISPPFSAASIGKIWRNSGMLMVFLILFAILSIFVPFFFTWRNMVGLSLSVATLGMVACTMTFALASGNFDLSVGSIVAFSGVAAAVVINVTGSTVLGILAGLAGSMLIGFVNGTVIAKLKINALITTLAMMQIVRGLAFIVSGGSAVGIRNANFYVLGTGTLAGIPMPIWIVLGYFLLFAGVLNKTTYGRNTLAIGGNEEAVRLSGINVDRIKIAIFSIQGLMTGFAGIVLAARMTSGQPNTSQGFELTVISACVLGGVSLSGGVASMTGALVGVLIMGSVQNAMNLLNVPTFYQYVARGTILLAAVIFDTLKQGRAR